MRHKRLLNLSWRRTNADLLEYDEGRWHLRLEYHVIPRWFRPDEGRYVLKGFYGGVRTQNGELLDAELIYFEEGLDIEELFVRVVKQRYENKETMKRKTRQKFKDKFL